MVCFKCFTRHFYPGLSSTDEKVGSNKEGWWWETRGLFQWELYEPTQSSNSAFAPLLTWSNECVSHSIFGWSHTARDNIYTRCTRAPGDGSREKKPQQTPEDTDPIRDKIESRARPRVSWRSNKSSRGRLRFSNWSGKRFKTHMLHVLYRVLMNFKGRLFVSFPCINNVHMF